MLGPLPALLRRLPPRLCELLPGWPGLRPRLGRRAFLRGSPLLLTRLGSRRGCLTARAARLDEAVARLSQERLPRRELLRQTAHLLVAVPAGACEARGARAAAGEVNGVDR